MVRTELLDVLFEVVESGERAIFYSTHILSDISRIADELAFLSNGKLKTKVAKDDLTEKWRRISFKLTDTQSDFIEMVKMQNQGLDYKIISSDYSKTLDQLKSLGAENILETRMSIDEIAVEILKK